MLNPGKPSLHVRNVRNAHAILYGVSVLLFAFAALLLRLLRFKSMVRVHYGIQIVATIIMFSGFACGVWLTQYGDGSFGYAHEILGTVLAAAVFAPLVLGIAQHAFFKAHQRSSWRSPAHIWVARVYILLMVLDACLSGAPASLAFGGPGALVLVVYIGVVGWWAWKRRREGKRNAGGDGGGDDGGDDGEDGGAMGAALGDGGDVDLVMSGPSQDVVSFY